MKVKINLTDLLVLYTGKGKTTEYKYIITGSNWLTNLYMSLPIIIVLTLLITKNVSWILLLLIHIPVFFLLEKHIVKKMNVKKTKMISELPKSKDELRKLILEMLNIKYIEELPTLKDFGGRNVVFPEKEIISAIQLYQLLELTDKNLENALIEKSDECLHSPWGESDRIELKNIINSVFPHRIEDKKILA